MEDKRKVMDKLHQEGCNHPPEETTCPNCTGCAECGCACDWANGHKVFVSNMIKGEEVIRFIFIEIEGVKIEIPIIICCLD